MSIPLTYPLPELRYGPKNLGPELESILGAELNVDAVVFDSSVHGISIRTELTIEEHERAQARHDARRAHRARMEERKRAGMKQGG